MRTRERMAMGDAGVLSGVQTAGTRGVADGRATAEALEARGGGGIGRHGGIAVEGGEFTSEGRGGEHREARGIGSGRRESQTVCMGKFEGVSCKKFLYILYIQVSCSTSIMYF